MNFNRETVVIRANPIKNWGGTSMNSQTYANLMRNISPVDFGIMDSSTWASQVGSKMINKPFLYLTEAMGNVMTLNGGHSHYRWSLVENSNQRMTIVAVDPNLGLTPGRNRAPFFVYGSKGHFHAPVVLKTENTNAPMAMIIGAPTEIRPDVWKYTLKVQDGDESAYIDPAYLQVNRTLIDATTSVSDEKNQKYGGIEIGSDYNMESFIGYVARKLELSDKFIRLELDARKQGTSPSASYSFAGQKYNDAIGTGYFIVKKNDAKGKQMSEVIKAGYFIPNAELLLRERIALDKEYMMTFGKTMIDMDEETGTPKLVGPGYHQMTRDGHYDEHQLDFTLDQLLNKLDATQYNTVNPEDRALTARVGEVAAKLIGEAIKVAYGTSPFANSELAGTVRKTDNLGIANELEFGYQFTSVQGYNGLKLKLFLDPTKDNPLFYPEISEITGKPKESGSIDIMDLGVTKAAPPQARTKSNMCMIYEPAHEMFAWVSNLYDPYTGALKGGAHASSTSKEAGLYMESSCKMEIFDISRNFRFAATV